MRFPAVQKFFNRLRRDKVTESLKVGTFLRHRVHMQTAAVKRQYKSLVTIQLRVFWGPVCSISDDTQAVGPS